MSLHIRAPRRKGCSESKNCPPPIIPDRLLLVSYWLELDCMLTARPIIDEEKQDHHDWLRPVIIRALRLGALTEAEKKGAAYQHV